MSFFFKYRMSQFQIQSHVSIQLITLITWYKLSCYKLPSGQWPSWQFCYNLVNSNLTISSTFNTTTWSNVCRNVQDDFLDVFLNIVRMKEALVAISTLSRWLTPPMDWKLVRFQVVLVCVIFVANLTKEALCCYGNWCCVRGIDVSSQGWHIIEALLANLAKYVLCGLWSVYFLSRAHLENIKSTRPVSLNRI